MADSAIQEDVQTDVDTDTDTTTRKREPTAREQAMDAIAEGRRADFEKETGIKIDAADPDVDPADAQAAAEVERLNREADETGRTPANELYDDAQLKRQLDDSAILARKVKVKIDGQESEVSVDDMRREYQKGRTADKRLEEAAELRRQLDEQAAQQQARTDTTTAEVAIDPTVGKAFTTALFEGDEEKANEAFAKAVGQAVHTELEKSGRASATPVDTQTIAQQVKQQLAFDSVLERNRQDYPQLYADADVEALAATKIQRAMGEGHAFADALASVSGEFAAKFGWAAPGRSSPDPRSTASREAKLERKARIDNVAGLGIKSNSTEAPPQTTSQVIAEIAKARGQAL